PRARRHRLRRAPHRRAGREPRVNFELTNEQQLIRDTVREFALTRVAPVADELDREARFPYELVAEMAELGLMGIPIPEEYGGAGSDTVSYAVAVEELTRIDSSVALTGDGEMSNIVVPNGAPGYEISAPMHKLGWRASDTRELSFHDCAVPEANLLGERGKGFRQFLEILDGGRISVAAMGVGLAQGAYDLALAYAKERHQFGKPIAEFQE